jgi:hypothetical protein
MDEHNVEQKNMKGEPPKKLSAPKTWDDYYAGVVEWLMYHWGLDDHCAHCNGDTWSVGSVVALANATRWPSPPGHKPGGFSPMVPLVCMQCGNTELVHALWIFEPQNELLPQQSEDEEP